MGRFGIFWDNRLQVLPVGGSISLQMKPFLTSKKSSLSQINTNKMKTITTTYL